MAEILIIDDNQNFRFGLATNLRSHGFDVSIASNGQEGQQLVKEIRPELILCDVRMPSQDGLAFKKALNEDPSTANIPFIFLSALSSQHAKIDGLSLDADDYIAKPFDLLELIARIETVLRREAREKIRSKHAVMHLLEKLKSSLPMQTSHQFRTQLGIILLSLTMIQKDQTKSKKYINLAFSSTYKIKMMTETLIWLNEFDIGRSETYQQQIHLDTDFMLPSNEIVGTWEEKNLQINFQIDEGAVVIAPPRSFTLAISHLLDNACKFSPQGGRIDVHLESTGIGNCIITIHDQGAGIPQQLRDIVFDRFYQVQNDDSISQNHGLGLGLYLARAFARTRGGDVRILESSAGCKVEMKLGNSNRY